MAGKKASSSGTTGGGKKITGRLPSAKNPGARVPSRATGGVSKGPKGKRPPKAGNGGTPIPGGV